MKEQPQLSIVIPCFNEAKNITLVLQKLNKIIAHLDYTIEVIVIDGGSSDSTPEELQTIFSSLPQENFKLLLQKERGGYGKDIMEALHCTTGEVLAWTHADLQTDPYDVIKAYELYLLKKDNQNILVKGGRKNRQWIEAFFTFNMQIIAWIALKTYLRDINAQPKVFSRKFYKDYLKEGYPSDFSLDLYTLYQAKVHGYKIYTLPVYFADRQHGEAKGGGGSWKNRYLLIKRTFLYIFALRKQFKQK